MFIWKCYVKMAGLIYMTWIENKKKTLLQNAHYNKHIMLSYSSKHAKCVEKSVFKSEFYTVSNTSLA